MLVLKHYCIIYYKGILLLAILLVLFQIVTLFIVLPIWCESTGAISIYSPSLLDCLYFHIILIVSTTKYRKGNDTTLHFKSVCKSINLYKIISVLIYLEYLVKWFVHLVV